MNRQPLITVKQGSSEHRTTQLVGWGVFLLLAILLPYILTALFGEFQVSRMNRALYLAIAILGVNLVVGYSGLIALGHSAFIGIGAFAATTLIMDEFPRIVSDADPTLLFLAAIPFSMAAAFVVGVLLGIPALRIKGLYLALLTIAFAAVFPTLMKLDKWGIAERTGGVNGRNVEPKVVAPEWVQTILFIDDTPDQQAIYRYFIIAFFTFLAFLGTRNLLKSRPGRAIVAIRDNETGAAVSGVNLPLYKTITFGVSASLGGLSGVLWAMNSAFVGEQDFGFAPLAIPLLVGLVIGGVATLDGAIYGALVVVFVREIANNTDIPFIEREDVLSQALFGLVLILVTFFAPGGISGLVSSIKDRIIQVIPQPPTGAGVMASAAEAADDAVPEPAV